MKSQKENIEKLLRLKKENPELEIVPMVDTECVFDDSFGSWMAEWGDANVDRIYCSEERIYFESDDYDTLVEDAAEKVYEKDEDEELTDEEVYKIAEEKVKAYKWEKVIAVKIKPL